MRAVLRIICLTIGLTAFGQEQVRLKELSFTAPDGWWLLSDSKYEEYFPTQQGEKGYEKGALFSDSLDLRKPPYFLYRYVPTADLNSIPFDTLKAIAVRNYEALGTIDTVVSNRDNNYIYHLIIQDSNKIVCGRAFGSGGTFHITMFPGQDSLEVEMENFEKFLSSIKFDHGYFDSNTKADEYVEEGAESSKWIFIFGGVFLLIYIIRKFLPNDKR